MEQNSTAIKERILYYIGFKEIRKADFFRQIGISSTPFKGNGLKSDIAAGTLVKVLTEYPEISPGWLLFGEEPMTKKEKNIQECAELKSGIPLISIKTSDGFTNLNFSVNDQTIKGYYNIPKFENRGIDFLYEVEGVSMSPTFNPGDLVGCKIVNEKKYIKWNEPYLIATTEKELVIKRIKKATTDTSLSLSSDNDEYDPFEIQRKEITGIALILGTIK
ncbi:MAG: S24 family peptidase [Flavobacteriia bacterium]|nr:S24 family peptidase [Flavobacteriia bacterium]